MQRRLTLGAAAVALAVLTAGCLGNSASQPAPLPKRSISSSPVSGIPTGVDAHTVSRLVAEWRAARFSCTGLAGGCPYQPGTFASGLVLLSEMRRINPAIPVSDAAGTTKSLNPDSTVFVLGDSSPRRLDLETRDTKGAYIRLVAIGTHHPRFAPVE